MEKSISQEVDAWFKLVQDKVILEYHKPTGKDMLWDCDEWNKIKDTLKQKLLGDYAKDKEGVTNGN